MINIFGICGGNGVILYPFEKSDKFSIVDNIEFRKDFYYRGKGLLDEENISFLTRMRAYKLKDMKGKYILLNNNNNIFSLKHIYTDLDIDNIKNRVIIGAPNCGSKSVFRLSRTKKLKDINLDQSFNLYLNSIKSIEPDIFVMENLPKLLEDFTEEMWDTEFSEYTMLYKVVSMSYFGNSQVDRKRLIIIGIKKSMGEYPISVFNEPIKKQLLMTTRVLMSNLIPNDIMSGNVREPMDKVFNVCARLKMSVGDIQKVWLSNNDMKRWEVVGERFTTAPGVYRNLNNEFPKTARKSERQFNPDGLPMSPRELARIQGIPDSFKIFIDRDNLQYSINKARVTVTKCPPYNFSSWVKRCLLKIYIK